MDNTYVEGVIDDLIAKYDQFLLGDTRNTWIISEDGEAHIYVRKALRLNDERKLLTSLDIANVSIECSGQGVFKAFLDHVMDNSNHPKYTYQMVYVENIFSDRLRSFLKRKGFERHWLSDPTAPSMYIQLSE